MLPVGPVGLAVKMYLLSTAGSNRLGGLDPQPLAVDLGRRLLLGRGDVVLEPRKGAVGRSAARSAPRRSRTVASHTHRLKPPRMFRPANRPKLVVGPSQRFGGRRSASARTEGTPCVAVGRNIALACQQQPRRTPLRLWCSRSDPDSNQTMTGARQDAEQRLKGGTVSLRPVSRRLTTAALSLLVALLVAAPAAHAAPPQVVHQQTIHLETETLETVCGDTAVFDWSGTDTFTSVDMTDGLYFWVLVSRATYTVTFQDPSLGVQEGRFIQSESVRATPGGTFSFSFVINERLGEVRIHETVTFVVSADGTIRVQNETFDFSGCPST